MKVYLEESKFGVYVVVEDDDGRVFSYKIADAKGKVKRESLKRLVEFVQCVIDSA